MCRKTQLEPLKDFTSTTSELDKLNKHLASVKSGYKPLSKPLSPPAIRTKTYVLESNDFGPAPVFQLPAKAVEEDLQENSLVLNRTTSEDDESPLKLHRDDSGKLVLKLSGIDFSGQSHNKRGSSNKKTDDVSSTNNVVLPYEIFLK
jgi:hypothetical protein